MEYQKKNIGYKCKHNQKHVIQNTVILETRFLEYNNNENDFYNGDYEYKGIILEVYFMKDM